MDWADFPVGINHVDRRSFLPPLGAQVLLSVFYLAICLATIAACMTLGPPDFSVMVYGAAVMVAILGVPHGGLDHWTGRRLLESRFESRWWMMFFPGYLSLSAIVAFSWVLFPVATVIGFFLVSAWHFGREDQYSSISQTRTGRFTMATKHLSAIALGGLVIWIPAIFRPDEMELLLRIIVPGDSKTHAKQIVSIASWIAMVMCPLGGLFFCSRLIDRGGDWSVWVAPATAGLAATTPILVSFTAFFCLWHSILGLSRLRLQEGITGGAFLRSVLPLSFLAVFGVAISGWWSIASTEGSSIDTVLASLKTLFIGLSAIAVPHLLLHEWSDLTRPKALHQGICCDGP
jgi:Brp/Blh family beta-carotene 15,15'-monooxygenase